jgi:hypothetical protein
MLFRLSIGFFRLSIGFFRLSTGTVIPAIR